MLVGCQSTMQRVNLQCVFQNNPSIHSVKVHLWDIPIKSNCQCSPILRVRDEIWDLFLNAGFSCHPSSYSSEDDCNQELHVGSHFICYLFTSPMLSKCSRMVLAEDFPITFFFLLLVCVENIYNGVQLRDSDCPSFSCLGNRLVDIQLFPSLLKMPFTVDFLLCLLCCVYWWKGRDTIMLVLLFGLLF